MLERKVDQRNIHVDPAIEIDSCANIKSLVSIDCGYSILPFHTIARDVARGRLACLEFETPNLWSSAHLVHHSSRPLTRATKAVHDEIPSSSTHCSPITRGQAQHSSRVGRRGPCPPDPTRKGSGRVLGIS
ncbi:LysR substrate binding domain-containing protein [Roseovarius azorensis]|uniref:LysR substrate binding domain-containing protein n=2 Tax=Roseovarius azorensis TaxID=1287727 RepID=A0A1H7QGG3_9RHOB|nr:LysR substrate binding domain-containing protein [Roseovarius azorensis]